MKILRKFQNNKALTYSWLNILLNVGGFIVIIPAALAIFDDLAFSFWLFTSTLVASGSIIQSSLNDALLRVLLYSKKKSSNSQITLSTIATLCALASCIPIFLVLGIASLSISSTINYEFYEYSLLTLSLSLMVNMWSSIYVAHIQSETGIEFTAKVEFISGAVRVISTILVIYTFENVISILCVNLGISCLKYFFLQKESKSIGSRIDFPQWDAQTIKFVKTPILKSLVVKIGGFLSLNSLSIVAMGLPASDSASFLFTTRIIVLIYQFSFVPIRVKLPYIIKLRVDADFNKIKKTFISSFQFSILIYFFASILVVTISPYIFNFLNVDNKLLNTNLFLFMLLMYLLELHHVAHSMYYETTNKIPSVYISISSGIAIYLSASYFSIEYGILGLIFSQFIVQLIGNNWYHVYLNLKSLKWSFKRYIKETVKGSF